MLDTEEDKSHEPVARQVVKLMNYSIYVCIIYSPREIKIYSDSSPSPCNAKVEKLFSFTNRIKTDSHATLSEDTLNSLVRISMEGPKFQEYDPTLALHLWAAVPHVAHT